MTSRITRRGRPWRRPRESLLLEARIWPTSPDVVATSAASRCTRCGYPALWPVQEVVFGGLGETLTIRNDAFSREAFMPGVLVAMREVAGLSDKLTVGLDRVLGL